MKVLQEYLIQTFVPRQGACKGLSLVLGTHIGQVSTFVQVSIS